MKEFIEFTELAVAIGIGFYLGFEGMKAITEGIAKILKYFIEQVEETLSGEISEEDEDEWK